MTAKELNDVNRVIDRLSDWVERSCRDNRSFAINFDADSWVCVRLYKGSDVYCAWATPVKRVFEVVDLLNDKEDGINEAV